MLEINWKMLSDPTCETVAQMRFSYRILLYVCVGLLTVQLQMSFW